MTRAPLHNFAGRSALVLHRSEGPGRDIVVRCDRLGIRARMLRGNVAPEDMAGIDTMILDIDTGHDGQLPWAPGRATVPVIGLVGSESPGRLAWALAQEVDAYLPLSALGNLFSALVIAHETFARKVERRRREGRAAERNAGRLDVIRAVVALGKASGDEAVALKQLRAMAMVERISLEEAARRILSGGHIARTARP